MSVDIATVRRIARLARVGVSDSDADLEPMAKELNTILAWVEQLEQLNTDDVEPMTSVVSTTLKKTHRRRHRWRLSRTDRAERARSHRQSIRCPKSC